MREVIYARGNFVMVRKRYGFIVINTKKPFKTGHTHVRSEYVGRVIIDNVRKGVLPKSHNTKLIVSHIRVSKDREYIRQLEDYLFKIENNLL